MRGIGCLMMVIVPVFAYAVGNFLAKDGFGWQIFPPEWYSPLAISPALAQNLIFGFLANILRENPILPATLVIALVVTVIVGGIISIVYGYMYTLMGPSRYGPTDVPPPRVKTKKYKR
ncbi:MAG TPA: hypothetical protein VLA72_20060 [Anaerolineales bacterium]|nr:hypothetical protein [Anaerolineales bacterium]